MNQTKNILITGGAGFIGGSLIEKLLQETNHKIFNIDYLGYASDLLKLEFFQNTYQNYHHINIDITNLANLKKAILRSDPDQIYHLAAESHVDRSIDTPFNFIKSNVIGTFNLLEASHKHFNKLSEDRKKQFKFVHISTDEVFGT